MSDAMDRENEAENQAADAAANQAEADEDRAAPGPEPGPGGDEATVATILAEVRDTDPTASTEHAAEMIRARLERAGIALPEEEVADLATQIVEGRE